MSSADLEYNITTMMTSDKIISNLSEPLLNYQENHDDMDDDGDSYSLTEKCETIDLYVNVERNEEYSRVSKICFKPMKWNQNIKYGLAYTFIAFFSRSLWSQSVLSAFIYLLTAEDPKYVGMITAIMGIFQLLSSFPAGVLADRYRRDTMLKIASGVGIFAALSTAAASLLQNFVFLGSSLALWGLFWGIANTSISALFADSINEGDRSYFFTLRVIIQRCGNIAGPLVTLTMFLVLGNEWSPKECAVIMCAGQLLSLPSVILLCFLKDDENFSVSSAPSSPSSSDNENYEKKISELSCIAAEFSQGADTENGEVTSDTEDETMASSSRDDDDINIREYPVDRILCIPSNRVVPIFIVCADITAGFASGMSIRYFPIFFLDSLKLKPSEVQIIFILSNIMMALSNRLAHDLGSRIGRIHATILFKWVGVFMLVTMVLAYLWKFSTLTVCTLYLFRTALINATGALTRSILMDEVPKCERAKWSSLESVNMFGWSGSALFGGFLVNYDGIVFNFCLTACLQAFATIPLFLIRHRVARERNN